MKLRNKVIVLSAIALVFGGCSSTDQKQADTNTTQAINTVENKATAITSTPNDAEIAHIVTTSNELEVKGAQAAREKAQNPQVKQLASMLIKDHSKNLRKSQKLVKDLGITPQEHQISKSLQDTNNRATEDLNGLSGSDFDLAYVDHQVTFHENNLATLDNTLIPNAQNESLKTLLNEARPVIATHFEHAKRLRDSLQSKTMR